MAESVRVEQGEGPIILAMPHSGTHVPDDIFRRLNQRGQKLADTDWHVDLLYEGLGNDYTRVQACFHRYVIDPNRAADDEALYPGQNSTGLVPLVDFNGDTIWHEPPDDIDKVFRLHHFHQPYHRALKAQIERVRRRHGIVLLFDCHSIRSQLPFLFEGRLPDLNIGTHNGRSCDPRLQKAAETICAQSGFSHVVNGRFKGGWTTRHYGQPEKAVHAIQLEIAQRTYLKQEQEPWDFNHEGAKNLRTRLQSLLHRLNETLWEVKEHNE